MLVVEAKLKNGTPEQYQRLDEAIKTSQFVRNSCVRYCMDHKGTTRNDLQKLCSVLANNKETPWVNKLNSQARQSAADRAWQSINRFYQNCHAKIPGKKGFPGFLSGCQINDILRYYFLICFSSAYISRSSIAYGSNVCKPSILFTWTKFRYHK